jgi:hypothetical protein
MIAENDIRDYRDSVEDSCGFFAIVAMTKSLYACHDSAFVPEHPDICLDRTLRSTYASG